MPEPELTPALPLSVGDAVGVSVADAVTLLSAGELSIEGRVIDASNATFYCSVSDGERIAACVYKPIAGERPLWDFPDGTLAEREVAAYEVSAATGWQIVPPTILREGPAGPGMVQLWIDVDDRVDIGRFMRRRDLERLRLMSVFDAIVNNSDRKGGHLLPTTEGWVFGIDHGVTFSTENKLRTVLWQWAGDRLPTDVSSVLATVRDDLDGALGERLGELLTRREVRATRFRVEKLITSRRHPEPSGDWPPVPWPPI